MRLLIPRHQTSVSMDQPRTVRVLVSLVTERESSKSLRLTLQETTSAPRLHVRVPREERVGRLTSPTWSCTGLQALPSPMPQAWDVRRAVRATTSVLSWTTALELFFLRVLRLASPHRTWSWTTQRALFCAAPIWSSSATQSHAPLQSPTPPRLIQTTHFAKIRSPPI